MQLADYQKIYHTNMEIKDLKGLLQPNLNKEYKIISYTYKNLLPPGENYGSTMLSIDVKVQDESKQEKIIHCVAKTVPPSEAVWNYFNTSVTFKKEVDFYHKVVPLLTKFGEENGVANFTRSAAKCLGARISLNPASKGVDKDAILVLEDLKVQGFKLENRLIGFDLKTAKLILKNLAELHAGPIALKLNKPEIFNSRLRPYLNKGMVYEAPDDMLDKLAGNIVKFASRYPEFLPLLSRIDSGTRKFRSLFVYDKIREPFASIVHIDLWTNNIMVKWENDVPIAVKFLDFQSYEYGSPARDVLFFIYSSIKLEILETRIDELIEFYYDCLIETLKRLKCDTSELTFDAFKKEVDEVAFDTEFAHMMFMLTPIFTEKGEALSMTEWTPSALAPKEELLHESYYHRLHFTVSDYAKRNWI